MMVGREVKPLAPQPLKAGAVRLKIEGLRAMGDRGTEALRGVDLEVRGGEIVGLAGVSGNGQRELAQCLAGLRKVTAGTIIIDGKDMTHASLRERMRGRAGLHPRRAHARRRDPRILRAGEPVPARSRRRPNYTRGIFLDFRQDGGARARAGRASSRVKTPRPGHADQESVGRQHPEVDHGARALAPAQGADRRPADARRGHRRDRVHPPAPARAARSGHGHPADLRRPGRNPQPVRPDRGDVRRAASSASSSAARPPSSRSA